LQNTMFGMPDLPDHHPRNEMTTTDNSEFGTISDETLGSLRALIGKEVRRGRPYVEELNGDAIRHYALGIGDPNPLWIDSSYGAASTHATTLAPPSMLYATDKVVSGYVSGLPGVHAMFAGTEFRFERPLRMGDRIVGTAVLKELIERPSRFAGRSIQQIYEVTFRDQHGEQVATAESYTFRTERDAAREAAKYEPKELHWSSEEISDIAERYRQQEARRRGSQARYIEDVNVGDALPPIIKGPYTATTAIAFLLGWGGLYIRAHGDAFDLYDRHPRLGITNEWGVPEPPERVHWDPVLAERVGVPGAYDYGPERVAWMSHVVTDWMGDAGFLKSIRVEVRRHNLIGELVICDGAVETIDSQRGVVTIRLAGRNHDGLESARGTAEVVLPTRAATAR
jgi:acyl dehydratase